MTVLTGAPARLQVQVSDRRTGLYAEFEVRESSGAVVTTIDGVSDPGGIYTAAWTPQVAGIYTAVVRFYLDAARTVDAGYEWVGVDLTVADDPVVSFSTAALRQNDADPEIPDVADPPNPWDGALGIVPSDLIVRTAIDEGIRRMRASPGELEIVLKSITADDLIAEKYGGEPGQLAAFIRSQNIPVAAEHRLVPGSATTISVSESTQEEAEVTLGDLHYSTSEPVCRQEDVAVFAAVAYNPATGVLVVPADVAGLPQDGWTIRDDAGRPHVVAEIRADDVVVLADRVVATFARARLQTPEPSTRAPVESQNTRETLTVGCHAQDAATLVWLHAVARYVLLRWKQDLLEGRGFERSVLASGRFARDDRTGAEGYYTRYLTLTGYVRDSWRKDVGGPAAVSTTLTPT